MQCSTGLTYPLIKIATGIKLKICILMSVLRCISISPCWFDSRHFHSIATLLCNTNSSVLCAKGRRAGWLAGWPAGGWNNNMSFTTAILSQVQVLLKAHLSFGKHLDVSCIVGTIPHIYFVYVGRLTAECISNLPEIYPCIYVFICIFWESER